MSQEVVGSAVVVIRVTTKGVRKQIRDGIRDGFKGTTDDAAKSGTASGAAWGKGFKAGLLASGVRDSIDDSMDSSAGAAASGAKAGAAYSAAFKAATRDMKPDVDSTTTKRVGPVIPKGIPTKNTKSTHEVHVRVRDAALRTLRVSLVALKASLMGISLLSAVAFAGLAGNAAIGGLTAIIGFLSQISGMLLAMPAFATAALAPIAAIGLSVKGVGAAFAAMGKSGGAAADTSKQVASAQKGVASAQKAVQRAMEGVTQAERAAQRASEAHQRAREDLGKAIEEAREDLEDLQYTLRGAALDEESAVLGVERARQRLADMPADSTALDWKEANLALKEAELNLDSVREKNADLAKEAAEANAKGVEGSDKVVEAKRAVADAAEAEAEAQKGIQDAVEAVAEAQAALADAMDAVGEAASGAAGGVDQFADAMAKLSPNAREFVYAIQALGPAWNDMRMSVQDALFENLGQTVTNLANVQLPVLKVGLTEVATAVNGVATELLETFSTPEAASGLLVMLQSTRDMINEMRPGVGALAEAWMNLSLAGAPFLEAFGRTVSENMEKFREWTSDTEKMSGLIQRGTDAWLTFWELAKNVGGILGSIFGAGAEAGGRMMDRMVQITGGMNDFLKSTEGLAALDRYFSSVEKAITFLAAPIGSLVIGFSQLVSVLSDFAINASPGLAIGLRGLGDGIESMRPGLEALGTAAGEIFMQLGPLFRELGPVLSDVLVSLSPVISELARAFIELLKAVLPLIPPIVAVLAPILKVLLGIIADNADVVAGFVIAIGPLVYALTKITKIAAIVSKVMAVVSKVMAGLQWVIMGLRAAWALLQIAFAASPIGVIVVGLVALGVALWAFFTKTETGRQMWDTIWNAIKDVFLWVWESILKPKWEAMKIAWDLLLQGMKWAWDNILKPMWDTWVAVVTWVGRTFIDFLVNPTQTAWLLLAQGIAFVWGSIIKPTWDMLAAAAQWLWNSVLKPTWDFMKAAWQATGAFFRSIYDSIIKPMWDAFSAAVSWVIDNAIRPAFDRLKSGLSAVGDFFGRTVEGIRTVWDRLKGFLATPINFLINTVWNNGLLQAWDTVRKFLPGLPKAERLKPVAFADGGPVPFVRGAKRGKDSVHGLLMPGEHVLTEEEVRAMGGHQNVYAWRESLRSGFNPRKHGGESLIPRFAKGGAADKEPDTGGRLAPLPGEANLRPIAVLARRLIFRIWEDTIKEIGGFRANDAYPEHPSGRALDVMVPNFDVGDEVNAWTHANNEVLPIEHTIWKQRWRPAGNPEGSSTMEDRGDPTQNHMDHVHTWYKEKNIDPNVVPEGLVGHDGLTAGDRKNRIKEKIQEILDKMLDPLRAGMGAVIGDPPPHFLGIPPESLDKSKQAAIDKSFEFVEGLTDGLKEAYNKARDLKDIVVSTIGGVGGKIVGAFTRDTGGWIPNGLSLVRNETGTPEAVLNWEQLQALKQTLADAGIRADELGAVKQFLSGTGLSMGAEADVETMMNLPPTDFGGIWEETMSAASISFMDELGGLIGLKPKSLVKPVDVVDEHGRRIVKNGDAAAGVDGERVLSTDPSNTMGDAQQLSGGAVPVYGDPNVKITTQKVKLETKMPAFDHVYDPQGGAEQWREMLIEAMKRQGYPPHKAEVDAWIRQIWSESKGDPNIAQQIVDSNGTGEAAGVGLGQMIPGTWAAYRDPELPDNRRDPWAMLNAMVRYGHKKYGDGLLDVIGHGHGYDRGGWLKDGTFGWNESGRPEPVFTWGQWKILEKNTTVVGDLAKRVSTGVGNSGLTALVDAGMGGFAAPGGGGGTNGGYVGSGSNGHMMADTVIFQGMDERKTFQEWDRYQRQNMNPVLSGRYRGGN